MLAGREDLHQLDRNRSQEVYELKLGEIKKCNKGRRMSIIDLSKNKPITACACRMSRTHLNRKSHCLLPCVVFELLRYEHAAGGCKGRRALLNIGMGMLVVRDCPMHSGPAGHSSKGSHGSQVRVVHVHDVLFMGVCVLDIVHSVEAQYDQSEI